jgi:hypothetical protein
MMLLDAAHSMPALPRGLCARHGEDVVGLSKCVKPPPRTLPTAPLVVLRNKKTPTRLGDLAGVYQFQLGSIAG